MGYSNLGRIGSAVARIPQPTSAPLGRLRVVVLFYVENPEWRGRIERYREFLLQEEQPFDLPHEVIDFEEHLVSTREEFGSRLIEIVMAGKAPCLIVSDCLVTAGPTGAHLTNSGRVVLDSFYAHARPCSLISLGEGDAPQVPGITSSVDMGVWYPPALRTRLVDGALRLHLLSRPTREHLQAVGQVDVVVRVAETLDDLRACFSLRHQVYGLLGYLDDETRDNPTGLEMDYYDSTSLHFIACRADTREIVGTKRLVFPYRPRGRIRAVVGSFSEIQREQAQLFQQLVNELGPGRFRNRLLHPGASPLPVLSGARLRANWRFLLREALSGVELSRLVANPKYRGIGVAKLLVQLGIATANDLGKALVLAEVMPNHMGYYNSLGFSSIVSGEEEATLEGPTGLGGVATAEKIRLNLSQGHRNAAAKATLSNLALLKMANASCQSESLGFKVRLGKHQLKPTG